MNIKGIGKAKVLAALYNNARSLGMGYAHFDPADMIEEEAQNILNSGITYFDYWNGRVMKVDLRTDDISTSLYNRDNGENAAEKVIADLLKENK